MDSIIAETEAGRIEEICALAESLGGSSKNQFIRPLSVSNVFNLEAF